MPAWQVEANLAAGHLVRLLADDEPGASTIAPDVSAVVAGFAEDQDPSSAIRWALARHRSVQRKAGTDR